MLLGVKACNSLSFSEESISVITENSGRYWKIVENKTCLIPTRVLPSEASGRSSCVMAFGNLLIVAKSDHHNAL